MTFVIQTPVSHPSETGPAIQASISDITFRQLHSFIYYMYICQRKKTYIMNKIIFILFISMFCLSACKEKGEQFDVKGHITSAKDKTLYFEAMTLNGTFPIDSVKLDDKGQFEFSHKRPASPEFFRLRIERQIINIAIDSTEQIQIEAEFPTMSTNYTIKGSENSEVIREISLKQNAVQAKIDQIAQNKQITVGEQDRLIKQDTIQRISKEKLHSQRSGFFVCLFRRIPNTRTHAGIRPGQRPRRREICCRSSYGLERTLQRNGTRRESLQHRHTRFEKHQNATNRGDQSGQP